MTQRMQLQFAMPLLSFDALAEYIQQSLSWVFIMYVKFSGGTLWVCMYSSNTHIHTGESEVYYVVSPYEQCFLFVPASIRQSNKGCLQKLNEKTSNCNNTLFPCRHDTHTHTHTYGIYIYHHHGTRLPPYL